MKYCVVWNSTTKGKTSRLVSRTDSKTAAEIERDRSNRTASMGGFYSAHRCSSLPAAYRRELGIEGARRRRRRG